MRVVCAIYFVRNWHFYSLRARASASCIISITVVGLCIVLIGWFGLGAVLVSARTRLAQFLFLSRMCGNLVRRKFDVFSAHVIYRVYR